MDCTMNEIIEETPPSERGELKEKIKQLEAYIEYCELTEDARVRDKVDAECQARIQDGIDAAVDIAIIAEIARLTSEFDRQVEERVASRLADARITERYDEDPDFSGGDE